MTVTETFTEQDVYDMAAVILLLEHQVDKLKEDNKELLEENDIINAALERIEGSS